jgi:hypothetical protein
MHIKISECFYIRDTFLQLNNRYNNTVNDLIIILVVVCGKIEFIVWSIRSFVKDVSYRTEIMEFLYLEHTCDWLELNVATFIQETETQALYLNRKYEYIMHLWTHRIIINYRYYNIHCIQNMYEKTCMCIVIHEIKTIHFDDNQKLNSYIVFIYTISHFQSNTIRQHTALQSMHLSNIDLK